MLEKSILWRFGLVYLLLTAATLARSVHADGANQAGFVVQFSDGRVETRCITLDGNEISGADLLVGSGMDMVIDPSKGMGITVCQIEGEGCAYPSEPCFCQCMGGGECGYWNYFFRDPGEAEWTYSPLGAILRKVRPGAVEAWVWGDGHRPPPDALTYASICSPPTPMPSPEIEAQSGPQTPERPPPVATAAAVTPTATPPPASLTGAVPVTVVTVPSPASSPNADSGPDLGTYWPFGLMVLALLSAAVVVWYRRV
jgi:hypothetical protein